MDELKPRVQYTTRANYFEKEIFLKFGIAPTEKTKKELATLFCCIDYVDQIKDDKVLPNNLIDTQLLVCLNSLDEKLPEGMPSNCSQALEELRKILYEKNVQEKFAKAIEYIACQEYNLSQTTNNKKYIEISKELGGLYASLFNILFHDIFNKEIQKFLTTLTIWATLRDNYEDLVEDHESGRSKIAITQALKLRFFKETFVAMVKIYKTYPDKWDARKRLFIYTGKMIGLQK